MGSDPSRDHLREKGGGRLGAEGRVTAPSGSQHHLESGDQQVTITEVGATLRRYTVGGVPVLDGFDEDEVAAEARGQLLLPWPNRVEDGRYTFEGRDHQLALDEPELGHAIHGLVRWRNWVAQERSASRLSMRYRLHPAPGYPFCLDLGVEYALGPRGLAVTIAATNAGAGPAPFGAGAHPYLTVGAPRIDTCRLQIPGATILMANSRLLPAARVQVAGTPFDFREERPVGDLRLNTAYTDLRRDPDGMVRAVLSAADGSRRVAVWADRAFAWFMVFSGDSLEPGERRRSLAVEPMTCPPNALRTGEDLLVLDPGQTVAAHWGIDVTGLRA